MGCALEQILRLIPSFSPDLSTGFRGHAERHFGQDLGGPGWGDLNRTTSRARNGAKGEPWSGGVVELGLIENVIAHDNSPDFGVHVGLTQRF